MATVVLCRWWCVSPTLLPVLVGLRSIHGQDIDIQHNLALDSQFNLTYLPASNVNTAT